MCRCCPDLPDPDVGPCEFQTNCLSCHTLQAFDLDLAEDTIVHQSPAIAYAGWSTTYEASEMSHSCTIAPWIHVVQGPTSVESVTGSLRTSNPYSSASPDNATADADKNKLAFRSGGSLHNGAINPFVTDGVLRIKPWSYTILSGTYYIPKNAWIDAIAGTHFSKNATFTFATEQFGTPNTTVPKVYRDSRRWGYKDYWCFGTMDYNGTIASENRNHSTQRTGLHFSSCDFNPWITELKLFALSCPAPPREFDNGEKRIPINWGTGEINETTQFLDSDAVTYDAYDEIVQAEADRRIFLAMSNVAPNGLNRFTALSPASFFNSFGVFDSIVIDTGATVADIDAGHTITLTATTTNVTYTAECGFLVLYNLRVQCPTISLDRTFTCRTYIPRCNGFGIDEVNVNLHLARCSTYWSVRPHYGSLDRVSSTDLNEAADGDGDTVVTSQNLSWVDWVNDHVEGDIATRTYPVGGGVIYDDPSNFSTADHYCTGYVNRPTDIVVGGDTPSNTAGLVLAEARYNYNSGAQSILYNADYSDVTIPDNTLWDITSEAEFEAAQEDDTLELIFDNIGGSSADITNVVYDGNIFKAVSATTATVDPYERTTFTFTVKNINAATTYLQDHTETTHDESGNVIPSIFDFTLKLIGLGYVEPPP